MIAPFDFRDERVVVFGAAVRTRSHSALLSSTFIAAR